MMNENSNGNGNNENNSNSVFISYISYHVVLSSCTAQGESFEEVVQNVTGRSGWLESAKETLTSWVELRQDLRLESKGVAAALCSAAGSSVAFLLLLATWNVENEASKA